MTGKTKEALRKAGAFMTEVVLFKSEVAAGFFTKEVVRCDERALRIAQDAFSQSEVYKNKIPRNCGGK